VKLVTDDSVVHHASVDWQVRSQEVSMGSAPPRDDSSAPQAKGHCGRDRGVMTGNAVVGKQRASEFHGLSPADGLLSWKVRPSGEGG